ncbi:MAG: hypothetical protein V3U75_03850 [Methylococcaceae bacterium]
MKNLSVVTVLFVASITHSYASSVELVSDREYLVTTTFFDTSGNQISPIEDFTSINAINGFSSIFVDPHPLNFNNFTDFVSPSCAEPTSEQQINDCVVDYGNGYYQQDGDWFTQILISGGTAPQDMYVQIEETT